MAKTESNFRNMFLVLFAICLVASTTLGFIYQITKLPIEQTKLNKKLDAIKQVVPAFTNDPTADMLILPTEEGDSLEVYPAKNNDEIVGYAVKTYTNKGFSGYVGLIVGFNPDGSIINIVVLEQKETPGLGTKMAEPQFKDQFNGKNPQNFQMVVKKDGGQVDAITAATISSRAFCDAVQRAYNTLQKGGLK